MNQTKLKIILFVIVQVLRKAIKKHGLVRKHVGQRCVVVQIKLKDDSIGRYYEISAAGVKSSAGMHPQPDVLMLFKDLATALTFLDPKVSQSEDIPAQTCRKRRQYWRRIQKTSWTVPKQASRRKSGHGKAPKPCGIMRPRAAPCMKRPHG